MARDCLRSKGWLVVSLAGLLLFETGLLILHWNPYWRAEPGYSTVLDHRANVWSGIAHLVSAIGLLFVFGSVVYLLSRVFSAKWLYWTGVVAAIGLWCGTLGVAHMYDAHYGWNAKTGITEFAISDPSLSQQPENALWQRVVRWQVESDLNGWLRAGASPLRRTHGWISIKVVRIVPIALPTLDCDCFNCCHEEDTATSGR
jgi:hypothetical protein